MLVTEAWRCGDPHIDAMRGTIPATVAGARVKCPAPDRVPVVAPNIGAVLAGVNFDPAVARRIDALEHVPKKLLGFFDEDMLQLFEFERFLFDHVIPRDREAL